MPETTYKIFKAIPAIMKEMTPIAKDRKNVQQGYSFRGIDDVYNAAHAIMANHGVFMRAEIIDFMQEERQSKSGGVLNHCRIKTRYFFVADDGSSISTDVVGEGMDSGDKAANKAMSVGQKYAILQTLLVPTDEPKDPEVDNPEPLPKPQPAPPSKFDKLDKFAIAKKELGNKAYYDLLGTFGYEHSKEIPVEHREDVLKAMRELLRQMREVNV